MANRQHGDLLKQGEETWNQWRKEHPDVQPDLREANFSRADLRGVNLRRVNFRGADLSRADLRRANLSEADLGGVDLSEADLSEANLFRADIDGAALFDAKLIRTSLDGTSLRAAYLIRADLQEASLIETDVYRVFFSNTILEEAKLGWTTLGDVDLSMVKGLETVEHIAPSTVGIDTIYRSQGNIPEVFLKGAGVPSTFIEYMHSLVEKPIDYSTCFISYSSKDEAFVKRLYAGLQSKGVRCWFAPEDLKIGEDFRNRIDESISLYDKLMVILSQQSIDSSWVEFEVKKALKKEQEQGKLVLFPIKLDETVMEAPEAWAADIRRKRHIGDFTKWKEHDAYQKAFARLLRDLKTETPRRP